VLRIFAFIDELPAGATGALHFGQLGVILVESKKICWAATDAMRSRLTDILCHQHTPPLERQAVEDVYRDCKKRHQPFAAALIASGLVTETGLRSALFKHNAEAILYLARAKAFRPEFVTHARETFDPKFAFSCAEILAAIGAYDDPVRAGHAQAELEATLVAESSGAAFVRSAVSIGSLVIAVQQDVNLPAVGLVEVCNWTTGVFDVTGAFDASIGVVRAVWCARTAVVAWRVNEIGYVGLCRSRAAAALLVKHLSQRSLLAAGAHNATPREAVNT
jgi:hypothetical protein